MQAIRAFRMMILATVIALCLAVPGWGQGTGVGQLAVTNNNLCNGAGYTGTFTPTHFNVTPGVGNDVVHLNISPAKMTCTAGKVVDTCTTDAGCTSTGNCVGGTTKHCTNRTATCSVDSDCTVPGKCEAALECSDGDLYVKGTSGQFTCTTDAQCDPSVTLDPNTTTCDRQCAADKCSGGTCGFTGASCSSDSDCTSKQCNLTGAACTLDSDCTGFCKFIEPLAATVSKKCIGGNNAATCTSNADCGGGTCTAEWDVCYNLRDDACQTGVVAYCGNTPGTYVSNSSVPRGSFTNAAAGLRNVVVGSGKCSDGSSCTTNANCTGIGNGQCKYDVVACGSGHREPPPCTNEPGSLCCGLTQGAYGATNSVATAFPGGNCNLFGTVDYGYIPAAFCQSVNVFAGDPNGTTIGIHGTKAVTIGPTTGGTSSSFPTDLSTLSDYLPSSSTAGSFGSAVAADTHYYANCAPPGPPVAGKIPDCTGGGSRGQGGGVLAGQDMASKLNAFLSANGALINLPTGFGGFTLPAANTLLCTRRSGADDILGNSDDVCQAFSYPTCVAGLTVAQVQACADAQLATGSNACGCTASQLNVGLTNINQQFDQCGNVIDCALGTCSGGVCSNNGAACSKNSDCSPVTTPGPFTCP